MDKMQLQSMKCVNQTDLEIIIRTRLQTCKKAILAFFENTFFVYYLYHNSNKGYASAILTNCAA